MWYDENDHLFRRETRDTTVPMYYNEYDLYRKAKRATESTDDDMEENNNILKLAYYSSLNKFGRKLANDPTTTNTKLVELVSAANNAELVPSVKRWEATSVDVVWATSSSTKCVERSIVAIGIAALNTA